MFTQTEFNRSFFTTTILNQCQAAQLLRPEPEGNNHNKMFIVLIKIKIKRYMFF